MGDNRTIVLEFEPGKELDWESEVPEWIKQRELEHEYHSNYLYIDWDWRRLRDCSESFVRKVVEGIRRKIMRKGSSQNYCEVEIAAKMIGEEIDNIRRIGWSRVTDTVDGAAFALYSVEENGIEEIEKFYSRLDSKEPDLGGVFNEDTRSPQEYFYEEYDFKFEFYYIGLSQNLE
jgi:hypothetical protein